MTQLHLHSHVGFTLVDDRGFGMEFDPNAPAACLGETVRLVEPDGKSGPWTTFGKLKAGVHNATVFLSDPFTATLLGLDPDRLKGQEALLEKAEVLVSAAERGTSSVKFDSGDDIFAVARRVASEMGVNL